ncbi:HAD-IIB family hydrolase [Kaarinaea lacus]
MKQLLLCTDLDRTLLPNGPQPESKQARECFRTFVERDEVTLVYVTGRHKKLIEEAVDIYRIPRPDFVIADVGSTIYRLDKEQWAYWEQWESEIGNDWRGMGHNDIHKLLKDTRDLRLQERSKQNKHKLSYYVPLYVNKDKLSKVIEEKLDKEGIRANLVWSVDESANIGLLDILPAKASKRLAIEFLAKNLNFDINHTFFSGDSGNDISVMASPIHSVLVANASDEVKEQAIKEAMRNGQQESLYVARGDCLGMNGNYSAGILEGIVHYIPSLENEILNYCE